jgi:protein ImuA
MPAVSARALRTVSALHFPNVWRAPELARAGERVVATGHAALDAQLPGGGWPVGNLIEILQRRAGRHAWQLLLPSLVHAAADEAGPIVLVNPPHLPFGPALKAQGLAPSRLLKVQAPHAKAALWAGEQALRCADVAGVMAWLPRCRATDLRRLHLAAAQHGKLLFVFRDIEWKNESSPARVRIELEESEELRVNILKRRGPPLASAIELPSQPMRLRHLLESRRNVRATPTNTDRSHVLDRTHALTP